MSKSLLDVCTLHACVYYSFCKCSGKSWSVIKLKDAAGDHKYMRHSAAIVKTIDSDVALNAIVYHQSEDSSISTPVARRGRVSRFPTYGQTGEGDDARDCCDLLARKHLRLCVHPRAGVDERKVRRRHYCLRAAAREIGSSRARAASFDVVIHARATHTTAAVTRIIYTTLYTPY